jgi:EpsI family protein
MPLRLRTVNELRLPFVTQISRAMMARSPSLKRSGLAMAMSLLMIASALAVPVLQEALSPRGKSAAPRVVLESAVPIQFGTWRLVEAGSAQVVNPQAQQLLDKVYSQTLTRTYANADGYHIMLSIAYGDEQRAGLNVHTPEICYPPAGFTLSEQSSAAIASADGPIKVNRMVATMGARVEPLTYWVVYGDQPLDGKSRLGIKIRFALDGKVPDGLLFRVSSIDRLRERAFGVQNQFVNELLAAVEPSARVHLAGTRPR